jgi:hypothetical protein
MSAFDSELKAAVPSSFGLDEEGSLPWKVRALARLLCADKYCLTNKSAVEVAGNEHSGGE